MPSEEKERTFQAQGTVCAKAGKARILEFGGWRVIWAFGEKLVETALERQVRTRLGGP